MKWLLLGLAGMATLVQAPSGSTFEVASIKQNKSGDIRASLVPSPGGRLTATNVTAADLIRFAYDLATFQLTGGPGWMTADHFDLQAKAEGDPPSSEKRMMLRRVLEERFKLSSHVEAREQPIYALIMAKADRRLGPQLRRSDADCAGRDAPASNTVGPSPVGGPPRCGFFGTAPGSNIPAGQGGIGFRGLTMADLARRFVPMVRRSVSDETGLSGYFDGEFDFTAELPPPPPPPGVPNPFGPDPFASVFTVLPEQLGLKLDARRAPVQVLVIDRLERPTEN
jgi:bla regulator protein blaR1